MRGALLALVFLIACASDRSPNEKPFGSGTPVNQVHTIRQLMRVKTIHNERIDSFRAQLLVEPSTNRVKWIAYTPVGTSAMTLFADGERGVFLNHLDQTAWQGR